MSGIVFVQMAESDAIDEVTVSEHPAMFLDWIEGTAYAVNAIRKRGDNLYKCLQAHTSQEGWEPENAPALWKKIGDPTVEYPEWSQPISAQDAYAKGDKVSYNKKRWVSNVDNNVWAPGVYGWDEVVA